MIGKILRLLGHAILAAVFGFAGLLGFAHYANDSAETAARTFCQDISEGSGVEAAVARAEGGGVRHRVPEDGRVHEFLFQGGVFNAGVCRAEVANRKVISRRVQLEGD